MDHEIVGLHPSVTAALDPQQAMIAFAAGTLPRAREASGKADHVRNLSSSCGSTENLNVSRFHGCGPYSRQTPATFTSTRQASKVGADRAVRWRRRRGTTTGTVSIPWPAIRRDE